MRLFRLALAIFFLLAGTSYAAKKTWNTVEGQQAKKIKKLKRGNFMSKLLLSGKARVLQHELMDFHQSATQSLEFRFHLALRVPVSGL